MADIGRLVVQIGANAGELQKTFDQLQGDAKSFDRGLQHAGKIASAAFVSMAVAAVAAVKAGAQHVQMLENVSQQTGIAIADLQDHTVMMTRSGLSTAALATATKTLSQQIVESHNPATQAAQRFAELGITATTTNGVLEQLADQFAMMPDGAGKTAMAVQLLGKSGQDLIPILNKGAAGFRESMQRSRELGVSLSDIALKSLSTANDAFDDLGIATSALGHQMGAFLAPAVTKAVNAMASGIGVGANFFGVLAGGSEAIKNILPLMEKVSPLLQKMGGPGFDLEGIKKSLEDQAKFGEAAKQAHEEYLARQDQQAQAQENAGARIVKSLVLQWHAAQKRNQAFGDKVAMGEQVAAIPNSTAAPMALSPDTMHRLQLAQELQESYRQQGKAVLSLNEALTILNANEAQGAQIVAESIDAYQTRFDGLQAGITVQDAIMRQQDELYRQESTFIGAADAARRVAFEAQDRRMELETARLNEELEARIISQETYQARLSALELDAETQRMQAIRRYPTFMEQQLQALVNSNAFSMGAIVNTWTSGISTMILKGGDLRAAWEATQQAILQSVLNTLVQMVANYALSMLQQKTVQETAGAEAIATHSTIEAAKTKVSATADAVRFATTVMGAKASGVAALAAVAAYGAASMGVMTGITIAIAGIFAAMGAALAATVVGAPLAPAFEVAAGSVIVAGTKAIAIGSGAIMKSVTGALATMATPFAEGGIVTGPTLALIGEAGPEAVIPLSGRNAGGMQDNRTLEIPLYLNGREIARGIVNDLPRAMRLHGVPA